MTPTTPDVAPPIADVEQAIEACARIVDRNADGCERMAVEMKGLPEMSDYLSKAAVLKGAAISIRALKSRLPASVGDARGVTLGENFDQTGRVEVSADHPLAKALRPSAETMAEIERVERAALAPQSDLRAKVRAFLAKWDQVEPAINNAFTIQHIRGMPYSGLTLETELAELRRAMADEIDRALGDISGAEQEQK